MSPGITPVLAPAEAQDIDNKIDDGKPGTGKVRAWRTSVLAHCTASDTTHAAATYSITYPTQACALVFWVFQEDSETRLEHQVAAVGAVPAQAVRIQVRRRGGRGILAVVCMNYKTV